MANDGDIIDYLFKSIIQFFSWVIGKLIQLVLFLFRVIFKGIVSLVKLCFNNFKSRSKGAVVQSEVSENSQPEEN